MPNVLTTDNRLTFVSGLFYYYDKLPPAAQVTPGVVLAVPGTPVIPQERVTRSYAGYVDLSLKVTDDLTLIGGFRHSLDDKSTYIPAAGLNLSKRFISNTWRAGAQYQWTHNAMTYFTISTGFRAGGFNPYQTVINSAPAFEPEKVTSFEGGARLQFFDRKLTLNPTVFLYNWDKIQVQAVYFPQGSTTGVVVLQNAGEARGKGFELEWALSPIPRLHLTGSLATLDLHYTSIGTATGITANSKLQRAPALTYSVGASYSLPVGGVGDLALSANWSYQDDQNSTPTDSDTLLLPSYHLLNARIEWTSPSRAISMAIFGTNLTNTHYYVGGVNYYSNVGAAHYDLGHPREFGVTTRLAF